MYVRRAVRFRGESLSESQSGPRERRYTSHTKAFFQTVSLQAFKRQVRQPVAGFFAQSAPAWLTRACVSAVLPRQCLALDGLSSTHARSPARRDWTQPLQPNFTWSWWFETSVTVFCTMSFRERRRSDGAVCELAFVRVQLHRQAPYSSAMRSIDEACMLSRGRTPRGFND